MNENKATIILGDRYRDRVHGTEGVAVGNYHYLTGCSGVSLEWRDEKTGEIKNETLDVVRVEWVSSPAEPIISGKDLAGTPGGPQRTPPSRHPR